MPSGYYCLWSSLYSHINISKSFVLHYNYKSNLKQFIWLIAHIYQYKVDNMILPINNLCILPENKIFMWNFPSLVLK